MEQKGHELELLAATLPVPTQPSRDYYDLYIRGLSLRVTCKGLRTWYFATKIGGVKHRTKIGTFDAKHYPYSKAADTAGRLRARAEDARAGVARNPIELRREAREKGRAETEAAKRKKTGADSFVALCDKYLREWAINEKTGKPKRSVDQDERRIERVLKPAFAGKDARDVTTQEVRAMLDKLIAEGTEKYLHFHEHNRRRTLLKVIYDRANDNKFFGETPLPNPTIGIKKKPEARRHVALRPNEIHAVWHALEKSAPAFRDIVRLNLLTGARVGEVRQMLWAEIDLDSDEPTWRVPTTKTDRVYVNPLSPQAVRILLELRAARKPDATYVFPSDADAGLPISWNNGRHMELLRKSTKLSGIQLRDMRRTAFTTMTNSCGVTRFIAHRCTNHADTDALGDTYDANDYLAEKREAINKLGDRIEFIINGNALREINPHKRDLVEESKKLSA